jgi:hypothetical protein
VGAGAAPRRDGCSNQPGLGSGVCGSSERPGAGRGPGPRSGGGSSGGPRRRRDTRQPRRPCRRPHALARPPGRTWGRAGQVARPLLAAGAGTRKRRRRRQRQVGGELQPLAPLPAPLPALLLPLLPSPLPPPLPVALLPALLLLLLLLVPVPVAVPPAAAVPRPVPLALPAAVAAALPLRLPAAVQALAALPGRPRRLLPAAAPGRAGQPLLPAALRRPPPAGRARAAAGLGAALVARALAGRRPEAGGAGRQAAGWVGGCPGSKEWGEGGGRRLPAAGDRRCGSPAPGVPRVAAHGRCERAGAGAMQSGRLQGVISVAPRRPHGRSR